MMRLLTTVIAAMALAAPAMAQTFRAENRVKVAPVDGGFEVLGDAGFGARGMWCAAADYARSELGAKGGDRIYIAQGRTPGLGQRKAVKFTMDATGLSPSNVVIVGASLRKAGSSLAVGHAYQFCSDHKLVRG